MEVPVRVREKISKIGGKDIKLVVAKSLSEDDLTKSSNCFSIPVKKVAHVFLKPEEEELMQPATGVRGRRRAIDIYLFIEPSLEICHGLCLKTLKRKGTSLYVLSGDWNSVVERNKKVMQKGVKVQLWSFRIRNNQLGFQLILQDSVEDVSMFARISL